MNKNLMQAAPIQKFGDGFVQAMRFYVKGNIASGGFELVLWM
ncbi:hypothetical protein ACUHMQ_11825 [Chitinimonas sp. PSY-7]